MDNNDKTIISIIDPVVPKFVSDPKLKGKQSFKWAITSQETESACRDRFNSIKICYICMLLSSVSFTITISGMWPFILTIDGTSTASFFGWIVSAYSIGQLLSSPLFGLWTNKIRSHKVPLIVSLFIMIAGNIIYFYLETTKKIDFLSPKYWMLLSRFIIGIGAACAAVIRSYVSGATNLEERTACLANISACQGIGFIIGPVIQAALVPIGYPRLSFDLFNFNMYTSPALISIIIYVILMVLVILKFNEYVVLDCESKEVVRVLSNNSDTNENSNDDVYAQSLKDLPSPDKIAIGLTLFLFFINCFLFSFYETLSTPLTIDMYAWTKPEATLYNGIILGVLGILAVIVVLLCKIITKKIKEKYVMLIGYIILLVSIISLLPWGKNYPSVEIPTLSPGHHNTTTTTPAYFENTTFSTSTEAPERGCPLNYSWCFYTPIVEFYQFIFGFFLLIVGYSMSNVMSFAIYSKLLGPKPQGFMMGLLTSCGSTARAVGPILVSYLYGVYGPRWSFGTLACIVLFAIFIIVVTIKRYEPYKFA